MQKEERIICIEEIGEFDSIDIEMDGNHLFFANRILTHNSNSDVDMTNTSESIGLPATVDALFAIIRTEELDEMHQIMIKVLKTRFSDKTNHRFICGINLNQMRITESSSTEQSKVSQVIKPEDYNKPTLNASKPERKKVQIQV